MTSKKTGTENEVLLGQLVSLGLSENDARIYHFLLSRGTVFGGSKIATLLSLHRQYVHTSLQKLVAMDLVEEVPDGARMKYKAMPPRYVTHLAKKKLEDAERVARELESISAVGAEQDFEIYRGARQVMAFEEKLVDELGEDETQYIIGGSADAFLGFFGDSYDSLSHIAKEKGLQSRYVGCPSEEEWLSGPVRDVYGDAFQYRILPALPKTSVETAIRFNTVTLYTFGNPPLVYFIKSKTVADDYKKFFDMLWNMAEPK